MDNYTLNNKQGVLCSSFLMKLCTFLILSLFAPKVFAQLDLIHYVPPFYAGTKYNGDIGNHWVVLTTPSEEAITVTIKRGDGTLVATVPNVSITTPKKYYFKNEQYGNTYGTITRPNLGIVNYTGLNKVLSNQGLIFTSENSEGKGVAFYVNIRHKSRIHGLSLTAKGQAALGTSFRSGHLYSVRGENIGGWRSGSSYIVDHRSHFISVMATEDNTQVTFSDIKVGNLTSDTGTALPVTEDIVRILNAGESYVLGANHEFLTAAEVNKFNGTKISSDKPIAVNSGSWCGSASTSNKQDIGVDQIVPEKLVGNEYILLRGQGNHGTERPIVVATKDGTNISVNGITGFINPTPLNAGESYAIEEFYFSSEGTMLINTSQNVYMYQTTAASAAKPYPTIGMNFIPPLSSLGFRQVDIPFINELGTGIVAIYSQNGADVYVNNVKLDQADAKLVSNKEEWVVYIYSTADENVSVKSNKAIYVAMSVFDNVVGAAGYFSGFTKSISPIDTTIVFNHDLGYICSSQEGNIELAINSTPTPDWYEWYHDIVHLDSIKFKNENLLIPVPTEATKYILKAYFRDPNMDILYNGDFAIGRGNFASDFDFFNVSQLEAPGKATLTANPESIYAGFEDFTDLDGIGKMLLVHSSGSSDTIWQKTINSSTDIPDNLFVLKVYGRLAKAGNEQYLDIYVNDEKIKTQFQLNNTGAWQSVKAFWRAGEDVNIAKISIVDANASGKDAVFALDSITFVPAIEATKEFNPDVVPSYSYTPYDQGLHLCKGAAEAYADISYGDMEWFTFLWEKKLPDDTNTFIAITDPSITGLEDFKLIFSNVVEDHKGTYRCTIGFKETYEQCGIGAEPTSVLVEVFVDEPASIDPLEGETELCEGTPTDVTATIRGDFSVIKWSVFREGETTAFETKENNLSVFNFNFNKDYIAGNYIVRCEVINGCSTDLFEEIGIEIFGKAKLEDLIIPTSLCEIKEITLEAKLVSNYTPANSTLEYSWYKNGSDPMGVTLVGSRNITPDIDDISYKVQVNTHYNFGLSTQFTCVAEPIEESLVENPVYPEIIITPIGDVSICEGLPYIYKVELQKPSSYFSSNSYYYNWVVPEGAKVDKLPADFTSNSFSLAPVLLNMAGDYTVSVSNNCGTKSSTSTLTVNPKLLVTGVTALPTGPYCSDAIVTFTVNDNGRASSYIAKNLRTNETRNSVTNTFTIKADASTEGQWQVTALNSCGNKEISFTIDLVDSFILKPIVPIKACVGSNVSLKAIVETPPVGLTYQWKDQLGVDIAGEISSVLEFNPVKLTDAGEYTCVVSDGICSIEQEKGTLSVDDITSDLNPGSLDICEGLTHRFEVSYVGNPTFAWFFNGTSLGVSTSFYETSSLTMADAGLYSCKITTGCGSKEFKQTLNILESLTVTNDPSVILDVCEGEQTELIINVTGTPNTIKWFNVNGDEMAAYAGRTRIPTGVLAPAKQFHYTYKLTGTCGSPEGYFDVTAHASPLIKILDKINGCEGDDIPLSMAITTSTGHAATDYTNPRWLKPDGSLLGNGLSATISPAVYPTSSGDYTAKISSNYCGDATAIAKVNVFEPISLIAKSSITPAVCEGTDLDLVVEGKGIHLIYKWSKDGVSLADPTIPSIFKLSNLDAAKDFGVYRCDLSSLENCNTDFVLFTVGVRKNASIITQPADVIICEGDGPATFNIVPLSEGVPTYQWYDNDGIMTGETADNISIANADLISNDGQLYYCIVSDGLCNSIKSEKASLTVNRDVAITSPKVNQTVAIAEGGAVNLTVEVEGTGPFFYQWYENNGGGFVSMNNIPESADEKTLSFSADIAKNGYRYKCLVSNACAIDVATAEIKLSIDPNIKITEQPVPTVVCVGSDYNFVVVYKNTATSCDWEYSSDNGATYSAVAETPVEKGVDGTHDKSTLTITTATVAMDGWKFRALIKAPNHYSSEVSVQVDVPANFTIIGDKEICKDAGASFNVAGLSGATPNTYVWKRGAASIGTNSSLNLTATVAIDKPYSVGVTAGVCSAVPKTFNITHYPDLLLKDLDHDNTLCPKGIIDLTVGTKIGSSVPETYAWSKDGSDILGANTASYNKSNVTDSESGLYKVTVEDKCMVQSKSIQIDVLDVITATTTWKNDTLCAGDALLLEAKVTGDNPTYKWTLPTASTRVIGDVSDLKIDAILATDAGTYTCDVTGSCGTASYTVDISINDVPNITTDLDLSAVCVGEELKLGPIGYDLTTNTTIDESIIWKFNEGVITDETSLSLDLLTAEVAEEGNYKVEVTNACGTDFSIGYQDVHPLPTLADIDDQIACQGENVIFRAVATGENLIYRWFVDDVAVATALDGKSELVLSNVKPEDTITPITYAVECIVSSCGTDKTETANLTVNPNTILKKSIKGDVVYVGEDYEFELEVTGSNLEYEWRHINTSGNDDIIVHDITRPKVLTLNNLSLSDAGEYYCTITSDCGVRFTSGYLAVKDPIKLITGLGTANIEKCFGEPLNLNISVEGKVFSIDWYKGTTPLGHHELNYSIPSLDISDSGNYRCEIRGEGANLTEEVNVTVYQTTVLKSHLTDKTICELEDLQWIPDVSGSLLTYEWKRNGKRISSQGILEILNTPMDSAGVYSVDISGKCGNVSSEANLSLNKLPFFISKSDDIIVCENYDEIVFSVVYGGDNLEYQWQKDNTDIDGAKSSEFKLQNISVSDAGEYKCVVSSSCGLDKHSIMKLEVIPQLKILSESPGMEICDGEDAQFMIEVDGNDVVYQWQKDGLDIDGEITPELTINPASLTDVGYYSCAVTDKCTTTERYSNSKKLTVNALPNSQIFGRMTLCVLEDRVAYNTDLLPNINYGWLVDGGEFTTPAEGLRTKITWGNIVEGSKIGITILNEATGCSSKLDSLVTLRELPDVSLANFPTYGVCEGGKDVLTKGLPVGGIYWVDGIAENEFNPSQRGNGEYQVRYSYTDEYGCSNRNKEGELVLKVDSLPIVKIMDDVTVGSCGMIQLRATTEEDNIKWSPSRYLKEPLSKTPNFTAGETTLYVATVVDKHGCPGRDIINVTVAPLPLITTINDTIIGECKEIELTTVISGDIDEITWTNASDLDEPNNSNPKLTKRHVGVTNYVINVTDLYNCPALGSVRVTVLSNPKIGEDTNLCEGETFIINTDTLSNPVWSDDSELGERTIDKPGEYELTVAQNDCELIQKIVMNPPQRMDIWKEALKQAPRPGQSRLSPEDLRKVVAEKGIFIFKDNPITLEPNLDPDYAGTPDYEYEWSDESTSRYLEVSESGVYKLEVKDNLGCILKDSVKIVVKPIGIEAPNAFTPNGSGEYENQHFFLKGISVIEKFEMYIYNRWGELMYKTTEAGYGAGWDGTYRGEACPVGTYVWILMLDGELKEKGTVTLLR